MSSPTEWWGFLFFCSRKITNTYMQITYNNLYTDFVPEKFQTLIVGFYSGNGF